MSKTRAAGSTVDHAALIGRCARGDRQALRALYDAEAGRMLGIAERIVRRRHLAEEALQEAFLQIWSNAGRYDPSLGSAQSWLFAIVRYRALSIVRDDRRTDLVDPASLDDAGLRATEPAQLAFDQLAATSRLRHCLGIMETTLRRAVLMAYVSGYTHGEIAGHLQAPLGTAKSWVRRGLAQLRECMQ